MPQELVAIDTTSGSLIGLQATNRALNVAVTSGGPNPSTIVTGQIKIAVTGTAVQLPSNVLTNGVVVKSKGTNATTYQTVGSSNVTTTVDGTGNGYILAPGEAASFGVTNTNAVWCNGTVGDIFTFEGN